MQVKSQLTYFIADIESILFTNSHCHNRHVKASPCESIKGLERDVGERGIYQQLSSYSIRYKSIMYSCSSQC